MKIFIVLYSFAIVTFINCETVTFERCKYWSYCDINEVRVSPEPCPPNGLPCQIRKWEKVNISLDFTTHYDTELLYSNLFWVHGYKNSPLFEQNQYPCLSTTCHAEAGLKQTHSIRLQLTGDFPCESPAKMRWQLWNSQNEGCCVEFPIEIYD